MDRVPYGMDLVPYGMDLVPYGRAASRLTNLPSTTRPSAASWRILWSTP